MPTRLGLCTCAFRVAPSLLTASWPSIPCPHTLLGCSPDPGAKVGGGGEGIGRWQPEGAAPLARQLFSAS